MKKFLILSVILAAAVWAGFSLYAPSALDDFINSLNEEQKKIAIMSVDDGSRQFWSYLPGAMIQRKGISLAELGEDQQDLLFRLLSKNLGEKGYQKTRQIIELENVLAELSNNPEFRDAGKYYFSLYRDSSSSDMLGWSFEGHHLSLNFTYANGKLSIAPRFMGANPAKVQSGKLKGLRTLAMEEDYGLKLVRSLSEEQKKDCIFRNQAYADIVTSNSTEVRPLNPIGIGWNELDLTQKEILNELILEYLSTLPDELKEERMAKIQNEETDNLYFGWAGSIQDGQPHYYRIQGNSFLIEYDNANGSTNHIHTVWRDFKGDFGRDLLQEHYRESHHH